MSIPSITLPILGGSIARLMAHPSSIDPQSTDAGLDAYLDVGGDAIYLHGEGGETLTREIVGNWLRRRDARDAITLAVTICHDDWDQSRQQPIDRFQAFAVVEDVQKNMDLVGMERLDLVCLGDQPSSGFAPVLDAIAREADSRRIGGVILSNWSMPRLEMALAYSKRAGAPPIVGIMTTELSPFTPDRPLWPEHPPFSEIESVVRAHALCVLAHAGDVNTGQCLFGDEDPVARSRPQWVERWKTEENARMARRIRSMALRSGRTTREAVLAGLFHRSPKAAAIAPIPALLDHRSRDYVNAARRPLGDKQWARIHVDPDHEFDTIEVRIDDLTGRDICALIREHLASMHANSPPESVHALGIEKLRDNVITVWSAWIDGQIAGCGALKQLGPRDGEIKSMRTREAYRRRGVGTAILSTILQESRSRGYHHLWLETGGTADFAAAHELYRRVGFTECGPFGEYRFDPFSRYMRLELARA